MKISRAWSVRAAVAFTLAMQIASAGAAPTDAAGFDGTWTYDKARSGPHRELQETVVMAHRNGMVSYSAEVLVNGVRSGGRFEAKPDGTPAPLYNLVTGQRVGTATLSARNAQVEDIRMSFDGAEARSIVIEHWLSTDRGSFYALLKDGEGKVTSVMTFVRQ